ncbi:hypothetical protein SAMN06297144_0413 [Sphingomonas guangdongensis]|uniref:DUF2029 domain-containing protein n=1 Tax=Sphingomonas guangdongensis TaxID=1141890 RepID=A0A285QBA2_9SPHN|nr:hypothetical protein [Sphingomonas guangdongensis]SOB79173.1 hypothetical protein SAMN06297144_0413 [Sphingomonas guangdongensis]
MSARAHPSAEWLPAAAVVASAAYTLWFLLARGYLPQPFVFDTNDTFMDWFNTAYWANRPGAYDVWRSIYPPLSFVFLDLTTLPGCYVSGPFHARDCDWLAKAVIGGAYALDAALLWIAFSRSDPRTALPRTLAFALGLPMLFTLERGNLILVGFAAFVIAYGPITRSLAWRSVASAVTINFKPYLILPALAGAVRREWRPLELAGIATVALYLLTLAWVGAGSPGEVVSNMANWVQFLTGQVWNEVNYSTSYAPLLQMRGAGLPLLEFLPSRTVEGIEAVLPMVIRSTQLVALAALAAAWLQPRALPHARIAAILLGAYLVTQSPGGYTQAFLLFLVLLEPAKGGAAVAIGCAYLLCLVGDWPLATILNLELKSWLTDRPVTPQFGLTVGHFARPGLIVAIVWALSLDAIVRVAKAHRWYQPVLGFAA